MSDRLRIPKSLERRLADCESHLRFLWEAVTKLPEEPDRIKQVAAELRVLACEWGRNHPLLLDLLDELDVPYHVSPTSGPIPIPTVTELRHPPSAEVEPKAPTEPLQDHFARLRAKHPPIPLREFLNERVSVYVNPDVYSRRDLILAVAQQTGSAHEDPTMEASLVKLEQLLIGGQVSYVHNLKYDAEKVLDAGAALLRHAEAQGIYTPQWLQSPSGEGQREGNGD